MRGNKRCVRVCAQSVEATLAISRIRVNWVGQLTNVQSATVSIAYL